MIAPIHTEQQSSEPTLAEPQLRAARMIAMGESYNDISAQLDIDRTTIYRWRKLPSFAAEVSRLIETAMEEGRSRVVRDVSEINDIVLNTLLDVAQNDASGSARVTAARALSDLVEKAEERASPSEHNVMQDQSVEIRGLLEEIKQEQGTTPAKS